MAMDELKKKFSNEQGRDLQQNHLQKHSKNSLQLVRNLTQVIKLQINDFSGLSIENMEYFLNELFGAEVKVPSSGADAKTKEEISDLSLKEKNHNLPEVCIEIDMQKLQFRHSRNGPKIFEICGKNSIYSKFVTRLSFITANTGILYSSKVFPQCLNQMSHVKEVSLRIHSYQLMHEVCLHFSNCYELETLNLELGVQRYSSFFWIISNYFDTFKDLQLPKVYKHEVYYDDESVGGDSDAAVEIDVEPRQRRRPPFVATFREPEAIDAVEEVQLLEGEQDASANGDDSSVDQEHEQGDHPGDDDSDCSSADAALIEAAIQENQMFTQMAR